MPRPQKFTVDYFSHDANAAEGKTLSILFNNFGHEGISAWWLLLERVSSTNNHVIGIRNPEDLEYLAAKLHFSPERLKAILTKMAELNAIDPDLFRYGYIWSDNFVLRLSSVYKTRNQSLPTKPPISDAENPVFELNNPISSGHNEHTKLYYTKETTLKEKDVSSKGNIVSSKGKPISVPDYVDAEVWGAFLEMRKKIKAPLTPRGMVLIWRELEKLKAEGHPPDKVLEQSIMNSWKSVYPLKGGESGHGVHQPGGYNQPKAVPGSKAGGALDDITEES